MKKLTLIIFGLLALLALGNDDIEIYIDEPHVIPHELKPIKPIPPIGTQQCEQTYLCDSKSNVCRWVVVCK